MIDDVSKVAADRGTAARGRGCTLLVTSAEGVPSRSVISSSWCTTLRPGKSGFPSSTSAKMQPMDQMSMAGLYFAKKLPHSSGARYLPPKPPPPTSLLHPAPSQGASASTPAAGRYVAHRAAFQSAAHVTPRHQGGSGPHQRVAT